MRFIDLFAGVGGFRRGMELAGHKCVGFCEWDKFAAASYTSMHLITEEQRSRLSKLDLKARQKEILKEEYRNGEWYSADVRSITGDAVPRADCWCFGAPCQDFSIAGHRAGLGGAEAPSFEKYLGCSVNSKKKIDLSGLSTKTLRECLAATEDLTSLQFSLKWMNWGTTASGKFSTQKILEYHKTESECILLDILEAEVANKFFLSKTQMDKIVFTK